jgi:hypothetical protein
MHIKRQIFSSSKINFFLSRDEKDDEFNFYLLFFDWSEWKNEFYGEL